MCETRDRTHAIQPTATTSETTMIHSNNPFGPFKQDALRLEAIRLLERRRLCLGLAICVSMTLIFLLGDPTAAFAPALGAIVQWLMR